MSPVSSSPIDNHQSYPSAARLSDSLCYPQYTASLKCLEVNYQDKSKCQLLFDDYKECKKKEGDSPLKIFYVIGQFEDARNPIRMREARLERNRHRSLFQ